MSENDSASGNNELCAIVNGRRITLREGSVLLIEKGDAHEIRNTGRTFAQDAERLRAAGGPERRRGAPPWTQVSEAARHTRARAKGHITPRGDIERKL